MALSKLYSITPKTVAKWELRTSVNDLPTGLRDAKAALIFGKQLRIETRLPVARNGKLKDVFSPGIWWIGLMMNLSGSEVPILQMYS